MDKTLQFHLISSLKNCQAKRMNEIKRMDFQSEEFYNKVADELEAIAKGLRNKNGLLRDIEIATYTKKEEVDGQIKHTPRSYEYRIGGIDHKFSEFYVVLPQQKTT